MDKIGSGCAHFQIFHASILVTLYAYQLYNHQYQSEMVFDVITAFIFIAITLRCNVLQVDRTQQTSLFGAETWKRHSKKPNAAFITSNNS